jgi:predicted nucleic acid-binding protein
MQVDQAVNGIKRLFLDTAPVIYYVERHPKYAPLVQPIFQRLSQGDFEAVTSPITLAETLMFPLRNGDLPLQKVFTDVITTASFTTFVATNTEIAQQAAALRIKYSLKLPDALQVATAIQTRCDGFLTNDFQLKRVSELRVLVVEELTI